MALDLSRNGYTHNQIVRALHMEKGSRIMRFRYFLLDKDENEIGELKNVESGSIEQSAFAEIKRTAQFRLKDEPIQTPNGPRPINWNTDRIQVFAELKMPDEFEQRIEQQEKQFYITPNQTIKQTVPEVIGTVKENGWVDFPLGVFLLSTPTRIEQGSGIYRDIEAYDKLLILKEDRVSDRYFIDEGTPYYEAMVQILESAGVREINIENSDKKLPNSKEYEPGTSKITILNDLASDLGYTQIWVDEYGYVRTSKYQTPDDRSVDYTYEDNQISVTTPGMEEELDLFDLPNVFTVIVSNPDTEEEFTATVENNNPNHPRSIPSLGRRVVRIEEKDDIADQDALNAYTSRIAEESSQVYGRVRFSTAIMPFHSYSNILQVRNRNLGVSHKYLETKWSMDLTAGGLMQHEARRTVRLT